MSGRILHIYPNDRGFVTYGIELFGFGYARTYTGSKYRNFGYWSQLKEGDEVKGLRWLSKSKKLLDADSPLKS